MGGMTGRSADPDDSGPGLAAAAPDCASGDPENTRSGTSISDQGTADLSPVGPGGSGPRPAESGPAGASTARRWVPRPSASPGRVPCPAGVRAARPDAVGSAPRPVRPGRRGQRLRGRPPAVRRPGPPGRRRRRRPPGRRRGPRGSRRSGRSRAAAAAVTAAWAWRLILVAILIYGAFRVAVNCAWSCCRSSPRLLLTALLQPLAARLQRVGLPAAAGHLVHPAGRDHHHRGRRHADRQPGQRRLPHAGRRGQAHRHPRSSTPWPARRSTCTAPASSGTPTTSCTTSPSTRASSPAPS